MTRARRSRLGVGAAVGASLVALALLAACSGSGDAAASAPSESPSRSSSGQPSPTLSVSGSPTPTHAPRTARIGVITSESGVLGPTGKGVRNSVQLAVREANAAARVPGWRFEVVSTNDNSNQSGGQQAASGLAADPSVVGVVGTLRSTIDEGVQPILNSVGVPLVSPGGTTATLTRRENDGTVVRPFPTYFRLSATDDDQGVAAARFAKSDLHVRRVAVVSDGSAYGRLLSDGFLAEAKRLKIARPVVRTLAFAPSTTPVTAAARRDRLSASIRKAKVGLVYFGGTSAAAAAFAKSLRTGKVVAPLMGGDELLDGGYLPVLGPVEAEGDKASFPGAPPSALTTARGYLARYAAGGFGTDPGPYGASAYDAARTLIFAFESSVGDRTAIDAATRVRMVQAVDATNFVGATGPISFDRFGDSEHPPLAMYEVAGGRWQVAGVVRSG